MQRPGRVPLRPVEELSDEAALEGLEDRSSGSALDRRAAGASRTPRITGSHLTLLPRMIKDDSPPGFPGERQRNVLPDRLKDWGLTSGLETRGLPTKPTRARWRRGRPDSGDCAGRRRL